MSSHRRRDGENLVVIDLGCIDFGGDRPPRVIGFRSTLRKADQMVKRLRAEDEEGDYWVVPEGDLVRSWAHGAPGERPAESR